MTLDQLNALDREAAEPLFLRCCGSKRWAREMVACRPFRDAAFMAEEADRLWRELDLEQWLEAFAAHPRIGEPRRENRPAGADEAGNPSGTDGAGAVGVDWSAREQAGMDGATEEIRKRLAAANREYEARFGFIYLVCATGKSADELLAIAERRVRHSRAEELRIAAEEQGKITRLRLATLLA